MKPTLPCPAQTTLPGCEYLPAREVSEKLVDRVYAASRCPTAVPRWPSRGQRESERGNRPPCVAAHPLRVGYSCSARGVGTTLSSLLLSLLSVISPPRLPDPSFRVSFFFFLQTSATRKEIAESRSERCNDGEVRVGLRRVRTRVERGITTLERRRWTLESERKKKENAEKGGMGGRHAATTQRDFKERSVVLARLVAGSGRGGPRDPCPSRLAVGSDRLPDS